MCCVHVPCVKCGKTTGIEASIITQHRCCFFPVSQIDQMICPEEDCRAYFGDRVIRKSLSKHGAKAEGFIKRWEDFSFRKGLESMADVLFCPKCMQVVRTGFAASDLLWQRRVCVCVDIVCEHCWAVAPWHKTFVLIWCSGEYGFVCYCPHE